MKILFVQDSLGSGGAERSNAELWYYLRKNGVEFKIVILNKKNEGIEKEILSNGFDVTFIKNGSFYSESRQIVSIIKNYKPSIVHSVLFNSNIRVRFAKLFTLFFHLESLVNTTYSEERFKDSNVNQYALGFYKYLDKITAIKGVDHFHSITETVKSHYVKELALEPEKITVIPRGRKPLLSNFSNKFSDFRSGNKAKLITVGRIEFQKGQIFLVKALKILKNKGYNFHLTILGRKGHMSSEINSCIQQLDLSDNISLEDFNNNVAEYLLNSDLFLFPSLYEGLGGALIEAQSAGLPIACNDIPVLHEVVEENVNAKFFNVYNTDSIVEAITFFLDDPLKLKDFGRNSLLNYQENFDLETKNMRILDLYYSLNKLDKIVVS